MMNTIPSKEHIEQMQEFFKAARGTETRNQDHKDIQVSYQEMGGKMFVVGVLKKEENNNKTEDIRYVQLKNGKMSKEALLIRLESDEHDPAPDGEPKTQFALKTEKLVERPSKSKTGTTIFQVTEKRVVSNIRKEVPLMWERAALNPNKQDADALLGNNRERSEFNSGLSDKQIINKYSKRTQETAEKFAGILEAVGIYLDTEKIKSNRQKRKMQAKTISGAIRRVIDRMKNGKENRSDDRERISDNSLRYALQPVRHRDDDWTK